MIKVGNMVRLVFTKDPEQHTSNVVIKGLYMDKAWVMYEQSGKDEIIDLADVSFGKPIPEEPANHSFVARDYSGNWLYWDYKEGYWYECNDPTQFEEQEVSLPINQSKPTQPIH